MGNKFWFSIHLIQPISLTILFSEVIDWSMVKYAKMPWFLPSDTMGIWFLLTSCKPLAQTVCLERKNILAPDDCSLKKIKSH